MNANGAPVPQAAVNLIAREGADGPYMSRFSTQTDNDGKFRIDHLPPGEYLISDRVLEAFRNFVHNDSQSQLTIAQLDADLDFVKLRLREEIVTAGFSNDAGARVLLDSDPQVLRALEALPDAKRLAESIRTGTLQSQIINQHPATDGRQNTRLSFDIYC